MHILQIYNTLLTLHQFLKLIQRIQKIIFQNKIQISWTLWYPILIVQNKITQDNLAY